MSNRELREWLGLTLADLLVYSAAAGVVAMYFVRDSAVDLILAIGAVVLCLAACPLGMKRDPAVSEFTNVMKLVAYPVCVALAVLFIVIHYTVWDRWIATPP